MIKSLMPMLSVIQYEVGQKVGWAMMTLMVLAAIALVVVVLMQKSSGEDMSAIAGYNQKNDSFFGKNKSQSSEGNRDGGIIGITSCSFGYLLRNFKPQRKIRFILSTKGDDKSPLFLIWNLRKEY